MHLTWTSFNNIRLMLMAFKPFVIFNLIWLINTSETIRSEEGALLDLICWPDGNAIPVIIICGCVIAIVIDLYGLYQLFKTGLPKKEHDATSGLFYYIWAQIITIIVFLAIMFYSGLQSTVYKAKIKGGITKSMLRYATHLLSKVAIDRLQTRFHCCGSTSYEEWFYIPWCITTVDTQDVDLTGRKYVADNVPYSCCSMDVMYPCIHYRMAENGTLYKYNPKEQLTIWQAGCEDKLIKEMMTVSWRFNAAMALGIIAMIIQVMAVRYLHTAYRNGLNIANQIVCEAFLLRSEADGCYHARVSYTKRKRSRTEEWVSASYVRLDDRSTSTDFNTSDEQLAIGDNLLGHN